MKKSTMILSVIFAGTCAVAPLSDLTPVADAAQDAIEAKAEVSEATKGASEAVAEVTPVEVVSFKTEKGEKITVVTFSDATVVVTVGDNPPLTGATAINALSNLGISVDVSDAGAITSVQTAPSVEQVQDPIAVGAVVDATVATTVVAATEVAKTEVAKAGADTSDAMAGPAKKGAEATDATTSSDTGNDTTTSSTPTAPSLGPNTGPGSSADMSFKADDPSAEVPDVTDASSTTK